MEGLTYSGIVHKVSDETTKKNKVFQILTFVRETRNSTVIDKIKNFSGELFQPGQEVTLPVFISSRVYNDRAYVDLVSA